MKKILTLFAMLLVTASTLLAQTPKLSYQMVVRNNKAQKVEKFNQKDLVYSTQLTGNINILVATNGNYAPAASGDFTATTNMNGMLSLTIVGSDDQTQGNGIVKLDKKLRDINWNQAKIVVGINTYGINDTMPVYPVPYALSALNHDSTLSTKAIYYYISESTVNDVDTIYKTIMANNELHEAIDSAIVFYIKNNRTAVKNLIFHFLGQLNTDDLNEAYAEYKKNKQLDSALVDTVTKYIINHYDLAKEIALSYARTADVNDAKTFLNAIDGMDQNNVLQIADTLVGAACEYVKNHPEKLKKAFTKILTTDGLVTETRLQYALDYLQGQIDGKTTNTRLYDTMLTFLNDSIIQKYLDENHYLKNCTTNENEVNICDLLARVQSLENNPTFVKCPDLSKPTITPDNNAQTPQYTFESTISNVPENLNLSVSTDSIYYLLTFLYTGKSDDTLHWPATLNLTADDTTMSATIGFDTLNKRGQIIEVRAVLATRCTPLSAQTSDSAMLQLPLTCPKVIALSHSSESSAGELNQYKGVQLTGKVDKNYEEKIDKVGFLISYKNYDGSDKTDTLYAASIDATNTFKDTLDMSYCSKTVTVQGLVLCKNEDEASEPVVSDITNEFTVRGPKFEIISSVTDNIYRAFADSITLTAKDSFQVGNNASQCNLQPGWYSIENLMSACSSLISNMAIEAPSYHWVLKGTEEGISNKKEYKVAPDSTADYVAWMEMSFLNATCKVYDTLTITYQPYSCADAFINLGDTAQLVKPRLVISTNPADSIYKTGGQPMVLSAEGWYTEQPANNNIQNAGRDTSVNKMYADHAYNSIIKEAPSYEWIQYTTSSTKMSTNDTLKVRPDRDSTYVAHLKITLSNDTVCHLYDTVKIKYQFVCGDSLRVNDNGTIIKYSTVDINGQCWMRENMRNTTNKNGQSIPKGEVNGSIALVTDPEYYNIKEAYPNDFDDNMIKMVGYHYNWYAAMKVCPDGWHLPSDSEWCAMEYYVDTLETGTAPADTFCNKLGERGSHAPKLVDGTKWTTTLFQVQVQGISGFDAVPTGYRGRDKFPSTYQDLTYFWTATENGNAHGVETAYYRYIHEDRLGVKRHADDVSSNATTGDSPRGAKYRGYSVRCVRDASGN